MRTTSGQAQHEIPLRSADGIARIAVRTGNNAAWLCSCGRDRPLLGYSDSSDSPRVASVIFCPECDRRYRVVAPGLKQVPTHVEELQVGVYLRDVKPTSP